MGKEYPLDIQNVGEDVYQLMSKGHHDPDEFMKQVKDDGYDWPLGNPAHVWVKTVPSRNPDHTCFYCFVEKGTRGAWPATYTQEAYGNEQYKYN